MSVLLQVFNVNCEAFKTMTFEAALNYICFVFSVNTLSLLPRRRCDIRETWLLICGIPPMRWKRHITRYIAQSFIEPEFLSVTIIKLCCYSRRGITGKSKLANLLD